MNVTLPTVLRPIDVAELFGVTKAAVAHWVKQGRIPFFRTPGGHVRFLRDEILPLVETHEEGRHA